MTANVGLNDTIATWRLRTNQLLTLTVRNPLFNAQVFTANGGAFKVSSNAFFNGRLNANGRSFIVNANTVQKGTAVFQRTLVANGASLTSSANVAITGRLTTSGLRNIINRVIFTGNVEGNRFVSTANSIFKGLTNIFQTPLIANGASVSFKSNTTITAANTNVYGKALFVRANTTFQGSNTNIRGRSLHIAANVHVAGNFRGVDLQNLQNVATANNGEVLIYYSANNTWAGGIIDCGTF